MPNFTCRFCNKNINLTIRYYCHLHTHINDSTINDFTQDEINNINKYYNRRKETHNASHYNKIINAKHECSLCNYKCKQTSAFKKHLIKEHNTEELPNDNIENKAKNIIHTNYILHNSEPIYNSSPVALPKPSLNLQNTVPIPKLPINMDLIPALIPLALVIPLINNN